MKSSLWFDALMLALILVASLICFAFDQAATHCGLASAEKPLPVQSERLASAR